MKKGKLHCSHMQLHWFIDHESYLQPRTPITMKKVISVPDRRSLSTSWYIPNYLILPNSTCRRLRYLTAPSSRQQPDYTSILRLQSHYLIPYFTELTSSKLRIQICGPYLENIVFPNGLVKWSAGLLVPITLCK